VQQNTGMSKLDEIKKLKERIEEYNIAAIFTRRYSKEKKLILV